MEKPEEGLNWPPNILRVRSNEVHRKRQNDVYLLKCVHFGIEYASEKISNLNLRINIYRRGTSGCEILLIIIKMFAKMQHYNPIHWKVTMRWLWKWSKKDML